jgi:hypothetical protein
VRFHPFFLIAVLLSASALAAPQARALPGVDDLDISQRAKGQGWLQATCTYYGLSWLQADQAKRGLRRILLEISKDQGPGAAEAARQETLDRDPGCLSVWPEAR